MDVARDNCKTMYETRTMRIGLYDRITGLAANGTVTRPITFVGTIDNEGKCEGVRYSDPYGTWNNVVVQGTVQIQLYGPLQIKRFKYQSNPPEIRGRLPTNK